MKKPRIPAILLILAMAIPAVLTSCNSTDTQPADTASAITEKTADTAETSSAETTREQLDLPEKSYDGYEFRILAMNSHYISNTGDAGHYFSDFGYSDELAGEPINDAVKERNMLVEEKYGVKLVLTETANVMKESQKFITAGEDAYDIIQPIVDNSYTLAQDGQLFNMYDIPHIGLDKEWWDSILLDELSMGGRIYTLTGDISMEDEEYNSAFYFNKALAEKFSLDNPYKLVLDGKWTIDKMYEMSKNVTYDINGDGKLDHNDSFGYGNNYTGSESLLIAMGGNHARLDKDGKPQITILEDRAVTAMEKINNYFNDKTFMIWATDIKKATGQSGWTVLNTMFGDDRLLFRDGNIFSYKQYRDMSSDFGMVPNPKFDEAQESYRTNISTHAMQGISVPVTNSDLDRTGLLIEALAYESTIVRRAYYDVTLTGKYARDEESIQMLDTILDSRTYDIGKVFGWGGFTDLIYSTTQNNTGFVSTIESVMTSAQTAMEKSYNDFMAAAK